MKSFFSSVVARDWESMADTISEASMKRIGSRAKVMAVFARDFDGWEDVDVSIEEATVDASGDGATVRFECVSTQIVKYKEKKFDCSDTFSLAKEADGKWHIHLPGGTRLRPM